MTRPVRHPGRGESALFAVPNLDDLAADPGAYRRAARVFDRLAAYCRLRAMAMQCRVQGQDGIARGCEKQMERLCDQLPDWARW